MHKYIENSINTRNHISDTQFHVTATVKGAMFSEQQQHIYQKSKERNEY